MKVKVGAQKIVIWIEGERKEEAGKFLQSLGKHLVLKVCVFRMPWLCH